MGEGLGIVGGCVRGDVGGDVKGEGEGKDTNGNGVYVSGSDESWSKGPSYLRCWR